MQVLRLPPSSFRNAVLGSLDKGSIERLRVQLVNPDKTRRALTASGRRPEHVFFLESGYVSVMAPLADGTLISAGTLGSRSVIGASALCCRRPPYHFYELPAFWSGPLYASSIEDAQREFSYSERFRNAVLDSLCEEVSQAVQLCACNALHDVEQRLSRWILLCHDEMGGDDISATHEMIATALGICRSTATVAVDLLGREGILQNSRARIRILNRAALEARSCECYSVIRAARFSPHPDDRVVETKAPIPVRIREHAPTGTPPVLRVHSGVGSY